jgi:hypothetical protein
MAGPIEVSLYVKLAKATGRIQGHGSSQGQFCEVTQGRE